MTDKPILFKAEMVRAILDGRKTMTRRVIKTPAPEWVLDPMREDAAKAGFYWFTPNPDEMSGSFLHILKYKVGDLLWVREAWRTVIGVDDMPPRDLIKGLMPLSYEADYTQEPNDGFRGKLRQSIFMPRWASRITLRVTCVKVERLRDISEADARLEGIERLKSGRGYYDPRFDHDAVHLGYCRTAKYAFSLLWESINGEGSWRTNPWVAAISFELTNKET